MKANEQKQMERESAYTRVRTRARPHPHPRPRPRMTFDVTCSQRQFSLRFLIRACSLFEKLLGFGAEPLDPLSDEKILYSRVRSAHDA